MYFNDRDEYAVKHSKGPGWAYWHLWVFGISVAFAAAYFVEWELRKSSNYASGYIDPVSDWATNIISGALIGLLVGVVQSLLLLRYVGKQAALLWLVTSIVLWLVRRVLNELIYTPIDFTLSQYLGRFYEGILLAVIVGAVDGDILGFPQSIALRPYVRESWRWRWVSIGASVASKLFGATFATTLFNFQGLSSDWYEPDRVNNADVIAALAIQGAIYAAITGFVLIDMLRHPRQPEAASQPPQASP